MSRLRNILPVALTGLLPLSALPIAGCGSSTRNSKGDGESAASETTTGSSTSSGASGSSSSTSSSSSVGGTGARASTGSEAVPLPDDVDPELLGTDECAHDDDCGGEHRICRLGFNYEDPCMGGDPEVLVSASRVCEQHCQSDSDCGEGMLCICDETGSGLNRCVYEANLDTGGCIDDSDCGEGLRCLGAWYGGFSCQHPTDECYGSEDCGPDEVCTSRFDSEFESFVRVCAEELEGCLLG